ncbi:Uu.00g099120.m01.CDS01 [Anthostomella pinea]|uniref:Uu.00g099120.m01.CDS01 n=1 Tax=Anthostomella pinea TaxID=933095 RepID=A0AAI8YFB7_9PEZI|nr:Uu.00g099120.m01.CDS01 [Anthostomella pinea]
MLLHHDLRSLFLNDKYADLTVTCKGREVKVHRAVVCSQSSFFDKACTSGFKESYTGVIDLPEDYPDIFEKFLAFLYTGNYDDGAQALSSGASRAATISHEDVTMELFRLDSTVRDQAVLGYMEENHKELKSGQAVLGEDDSDESEPDSPSESPVSMAERTFAALEVMLTSIITKIRFYTMADKFDVNAARLLARERLCYHTKIFLLSVPSYSNITPAAVLSLSENRSRMMYAGFSTAVDELYGTTAPYDVIIQKLLCPWIGTAFEKEPWFRKPLIPVMRKHADLALAMILWIVEDEPAW